MATAAATSSIDIEAEPAIYKKGDTWWRRWFSINSCKKHNKRKKPFGVYVHSTRQKKETEKCKSQQPEEFQTGRAVIVGE